MPCEKPPCAPPDVPGPPRDLQLPPEDEYRELRETGVFVAPPRSGVTQGPVNRVGIEGLSLTFPEIRITTPRLELPAFFRTRSEARMHLDRGVAPYVRTGYEYVGAPAANRDLATQAPPSREVAPPSCEEQLRELQQRYQELEQQARQLERSLEQQRDVQQRDLWPAPPSPSRLVPSPEKQAPPLPPPDYGSRRRGTSRLPKTEVASSPTSLKFPTRPVSYPEAKPATNPITEPGHLRKAVIREPVRPAGESTR